MSIAYTMMPLGDSLTDGFNIRPGYRNFLFDSLEGADWNIEFVGSKGTEPRRHEGVLGITIEGITANASWENYSPDTILLMAGTNNLRFFQDDVDTESAINQFDTLISEIHDDLPETQIFVASIPFININGGFYDGIQDLNNDSQINDLDQNLLNDEVIEYNEGIESLAEFRNNTHFVDINQIFTNPDGTPSLELINSADGVHFDPSTGSNTYQEIAEAWFNEINFVFDNFKVTNTNDSGQGSLRQAILNANTFPGVNTITFEGEIFADGVPDTITLTSGELTITDDLTIDGSEPDEGITINGNNQFPVFFVDDNDYDTLSEVLINELTITEGRGGIVNYEDLTVENSMISNNRAAEGGGIENFGDLSLFNSTISNNISEEDGAGVWNAGNLTVIDSAIIGNESETEQGGGLYHVGDQMTVINSTISENVAYGAAGILNGAGSTATISHSTIYNNSSSADSGGIRNVGELTITHSIVAGNTAITSEPDVDGNFVSNGYNLIGNGDGSTGFTNGINGDQVGTGSNPINPLLGPLQNNGGSTETHALLAGSPAIDAGDPNFTPPPEFDQRGSGFPRVLDGDNDGTATVDIGAFESEFPPPTTDIIGTPGDDHLRGTDNGERIFGLAGDDHLRGRDGNDEIFGGPGDDRIRGDDDNDTLIGGPGDDRMRGGDGSDTFVLAAGEGTDVIRDFELSEGDQIGLAGGLQFSQLSFESDQILLGTEVL
jgi:hypothetical protein